MTKVIDFNHDRTVISDIVISGPLHNNTTDYGAVHFS